MPRLLLTGTVVSTMDPLGLGRVQVRLHGFETAIDLPWLRFITPSAGPPPGGAVAAAGGESSGTGAAGTSGDALTSDSATAGGISDAVEQSGLFGISSQSDGTALASPDTAASAASSIIEALTSDSSGSSSGAPGSTSSGSSMSSETSSVPTDPASAVGSLTSSLSASNFGGGSEIMSSLSDMAESAVSGALVPPLITPMDSAFSEVMQESSSYMSGLPTASPPLGGDLAARVSGAATAGSSSTGSASSVTSAASAASGSTSPASTTGTASASTGGASARDVPPPPATTGATPAPVEAVPPATPAPSIGHGWIFLPEVGDEVAVFNSADDDPDGMVVMGCLYNGANRPSYSNQDGLNSTKVIRTRSGNQIVISDAPGMESITVQAGQTGLLTLTMDQTTGSVAITAPMAISLTAPMVSINAGMLNLTGAASVALTSPMFTLGAAVTMVGGAVIPNPSAAAAGSGASNSASAGSSGAGGAGGAGGAASAASAGGAASGAGGAASAGAPGTGGGTEGAT